LCALLLSRLLSDWIEAANLLIDVAEPGIPFHLVAAFELDADVTHPADFAIARDGGVANYSDLDSLESGIRSLKALGYYVIRVHAGDWRQAGDMLDGLAGALEFPDYFGRNVSALIDCLDDVAHGDYGWDRSMTGLATVLDRFRPFVERCPPSAEMLSTVLSAASRKGLLFGRRLLWLLDIS
jgi:hypothetical protein